MRRDIYVAQDPPNWLAALLLTACGPPRESRIVIGSKNFSEQAVLGELFAQRLEAKTNLHIERRFYLAGTFICQQAILAGRIDIYPEYTGTALAAVLKETPQGSRQAVYDRVQSEYARQFDLRLGPPLGFDDTFAIVIRGEDARRLKLQSISQAAAYAPQWRPGFGMSSWSVRMDTRGSRRRTAALCGGAPHHGSWAAHAGAQRKAA